CLLHYRYRRSFPTRRSSDLAVADDDPVGNAHQLHVRKLHARALVTVVQNDFHAFRGQLFIELFGRFTDRVGFVMVQRHNGQTEGRDGFGPDNAALVVVLLDGGGHDPGNADAVAAHGHHHGLAVLVQRGGFHGVGIVAAELEDMADFNAALDYQRAFAVGARITFHDATQVEGFTQGEVALPVHASQVLAVFISATDKIRQMGRATVDDHRNGQAHRADRAGV